MKRYIDYFLLEWKQDPTRKPLLLRGARQVGKTYAARTLGATFQSFIELNLETDAGVRELFASTLDIDYIMLRLAQFAEKPLIPGETLLFIDEIQHVPQAITALRYFYEKYPQLHVIAAGSLLEFAIEEVGMPVGRITSRYMYPLSFLEFLVASGKPEWAIAITQQAADGVMNDALHKPLLHLVSIYLAVGGMPAAVDAWSSTYNLRKVQTVHTELLDTYRQDFAKYAKKHQIKFLEILLQKSLEQLGGPFVFARVGEYQKRELAPALNLLEKAGLIHKSFCTAAQGIPLGAQADLDRFKVILCDVGLTQALLALDLTTWFTDESAAFINQGALVESFVGQEMLVYADPLRARTLFYWQRIERGSSAEVDYVVQLRNEIVPMEVKAGSSRRLKSILLFLATHQQSTHAIRFSAHPYSVQPPVHSYPLYAIVKPLLDASDIVRDAIAYLVA